MGGTTEISVKIENRHVLDDIRDLMCVLLNNDFLIFITAQDKWECSSIKE